MEDEIASLNLDDFDIEELERRIELGQLIPPTDASDDDCGTFTCKSFGDGCRSFSPPQ